MKRIKVADASGSRRAEERLVIKRKGTTIFERLESVWVTFDDEYVRNGCREADAALYTVENIVIESDQDRARGMYTITLLKVPGAKS